MSAHSVTLECDVTALGHVIDALRARRNAHAAYGRAIRAAGRDLDAAEPLVAEARARIATAQAALDAALLTLEELL